MASILIIEDESALNDLIRTELQAEGHVVRQARDGRTALQMVEEQAPQLVILDWMLPGLDGLSVCRQLREKHLMPIIMLIACSAWRWGGTTTWSSHSGCVSSWRARGPRSGGSSSMPNAANAWARRNR